MDDYGSAVGDPPPEQGDKSKRMEAKLLRWDAAIRRSAAEMERVDAAHQRAKASRERSVADRERAESAHDRADRPAEEIGGVQVWESDRRDRLADQRDAVADRRDRIADQRDFEADQREGIADQREAEADERERLQDQRDLAAEMARSAEGIRSAPSGETSLLRDDLAQRGAMLRARAAKIAGLMADEAEQFAAFLENSSTHGDRERRLEIAKTEREIARIERQNAARLRDPRGGYELVEHLPSLRRTGAAEET